MTFTKLKDVHKFNNRCKIRDEIMVSFTLARNNGILDHWPDLRRPVGVRDAPRCVLGVR